MFHVPLSILRAVVGVSSTTLFAAPVGASKQYLHSSTLRMRPSLLASAEGFCDGIASLFAVDRGEAMATATGNARDGSCQERYGRRAEHVVTPTL